MQQAAFSVAGCGIAEMLLSTATDTPCLASTQTLKVPKGRVEVEIVDRGMGFAGHEGLQETGRLCATQGLKKSERLCKKCRFFLACR